MDEEGRQVWPGYNKMISFLLDCFFCYCGLVLVLNLLQFFTPILDEVLEDIEGGRFSVQVNFIQ